MVKTQGAVPHFIGALGITLLLWLISGNAFAETNQPSFTAASPASIQLDLDNSTQLDLSRLATVAKSSQLDTLPQALAEPQRNWRPLNASDTQKLGLHNFWLHFSLVTNEEQLARIIALDNPNLDNVRIYHLLNGRLIDTLVLGDSQPFALRRLQSNIFLYPFSMQSGERHDFYLKIDSKGSGHLPLTLWSQSEFAQFTESHSTIMGFQLGALAAIGVFSLFIALASRSFSYSYYAGYVLSMTLLVATLNGFAFRYLWPQWPVLQTIMVPLVLPLVMAFALMFTEKVLQLKYHNIRMLRICRYSATYAVLLSFISPFLGYSLVLYIQIISVLAISAVLMVLAMVQAVRGHKLAKLYAISWFAMLLGAFISSLSYLGLVTINTLPQTPVLLGLTAEIIFMSAVLAIRYNDERKSKLRIQQEALQQAERIRLAREDALKAEAESNEKLEQMVQERTLELEITLRELNEVNDKLLEQTTIDSLTGVKNRNAFDKRLIAEGRISRRQQTPMAILMLDIDKFKTINDKFGHLAGDQTLRLVADCLQSQLKRPTDLVSRFGGEEFAIILPNTSREGAEQVAELIRQAIAELPVMWDGKAILLTASIGVSAEIVESDTHPIELLEHADKALYQAKHQGRNRVNLYAPESHTSPV